MGGGVIGQGWAAHLLGQGCEVALFDPRVTRDQIRGYVEHATPALEALGQGEGLAGWTERLTIADTLEESLEGASWVQENGPEHWDVKGPLLTRVDSCLGSEVTIASSTSGVMPSQLATACARAPERIIVGHPFNPVQLIPLVEVVGGELTDRQVVEGALEFYRAVGKRPVHVRAEVPGHLANRLQAALWQEAYSLIDRGVATVADIDAAVSNGPGLRWALLGPIANQHLSGGPGGLGHVLKHLGPPTQTWMDDLRRVQLDDALAERLVGGVRGELDSIDSADLVVARDELLVTLLRAKNDQTVLP